MYDIVVPCLDEFDINSAPARISLVLDELPRFAINNKPWPGHLYFPQVSFSMAYSRDSVMVKFYVKENAIRGENFMDNSPVHEDSCVEFFISFEEDSSYYNLEINCIGTCLFGYGTGKADRKMIDPLVIRKIKRHIEIQHALNNDTYLVNWELTLIIPAEVFVFHRIPGFAGQKCRVNFFKCGDKLPEPHFLTWKHIKSNTPNFHLPVFFGSMYFN